MRAAARTHGLNRVLTRALPPLAITIGCLSIGLSIWASWQAGTLGYDYLSYDAAARRFLTGGPLYDVAFDVPGPFGLFFYPPTFGLLVLPLTALSTAAAVWVVTALLTGCFVLAVAILPVPARTRWLVLLLGSISWPLVDAIKLGQVGTLLLLLFAIGWRWMDEPLRLGAAAALGTVIKLQPLLVLGWAFATGRRSALAFGFAGIAVIGAVGTTVFGPSSWLDFIGLVTRLSQPVTASHVVTAGRVALEAGLGSTAAWGIQLAFWVVVAAGALYAVYRMSVSPGYLSVVIASQALSPILWDHYAVMLLLPVAWLVARGAWWAVLIPLAMAWPLISLTPPAVYPIAYLVALAGVILVGRDERRPLSTQAPRGTDAILGR